MVIRVDRAGRLPAYLQIRNQLREQILRGDLPPGSRLLPERELARRLGVSRTSVVSAYDELVALGRRLERYEVSPVEPGITWQMNDTGR